MYRCYVSATYIYKVTHFDSLQGPKSKNKTNQKLKQENSTSRMILQEHSISLDILGQIWPTATLLWLWECDENLKEWVNFAHYYKYIATCALLQFQPLPNLGSESWMISLHIAV